MIHQPFKARLKLALPCYVKFMHSPYMLPLQFLLPTILTSVLQCSRFYKLNLKVTNLITKIHFSPELLKHLIIHEFHSKQLSDTIGGRCGKNIDFSLISPNILSFFETKLPDNEKIQNTKENTSKRLSLRSKIPGVEWTPPIDQDHREAGVGWDPPLMKGVGWDPPINQKHGV